MKTRKTRRQKSLAARRRLMNGLEAHRQEARATLDSLKGADRQTIKDTMHGLAAKRETVHHAAGAPRRKPLSRQVRDRLAAALFRELNVKPNPPQEFARDE